MTGDGYVTDVPYVSTFFPELAPAWLDHVAIIHRVTPPSRQDGFDWCDLGCGLGGTATILAATHPSGRFVGIDFMAMHIASAQRFAADAGASNVAFHHASFAEAATLNLPMFDYIVVHGVYAWVDAGTRQELTSFIEQRVKPGGLVYVSYNALPGRGPDVGLQRLLRMIAQGEAGNSLERMNAAMAVVRNLTQQRPVALDGLLAQVAQWEGREHRDTQYLAHELMTEHWMPLFVNDVRAAMAKIGLAPVGSASLIDNHDSFVLRRAERDVLAPIKDDDARELARDVILNRTFRRDVFTSHAKTLTDAERRDRLSDSTFCLSRPGSHVEYSVATPAGRLGFDNRHARTIVAALTAGPRRLAHVADGSGEGRSIYAANMLALCAAGMARPVERTETPVGLLNAAIGRRLDEPDELLHVALPCGTAIGVDRRLLRHLADGQATDDAHADWRGFFERHSAWP